MDSDQAWPEFVVPMTVYLKVCDSQANRQTLILLVGFSTESPHQDRLTVLGTVAIVERVS
jgi:hypothetical protein